MVSISDNFGCQVGTLLYLNVHTTISCEKVEVPVSYLHKSQYYEKKTLPSKSLDPAPILLHTERDHSCLKSTED